MTRIELQRHTASARRCARLAFGVALACAAGAALAQADAAQRPAGANATAAAPAAAGSPGSAAASRVGEVVFAVGAPMRVLAGGTEPVRRGSTVGVGDVLITGAGDHVHVRFVDGAFVSVRPGSRLVLEAYQFDATAPAQSRVKFDLQTGVARSITGRAGESAKDRFRLNTPVAAIGIRGTDFSVLADAQESRVAVHSGAVVVAPLGNGCRADALGPCGGDRARELTADVANSFARVDRQRVEVLTPTGPALTPDKVSPPADSEPAARAPSGEDRSRSGAITEFLASRGVGSGVVVRPDQGAAPPAAPAALVWGRWSSVAWEGDASVALAQAAAGRQVTVGNAQFALYRTSEPSFSMPAQGKVDFTLRDAQVHLITAGAAPSPGSVSDARLTLDFDAGRFATSLKASHPAIAGGPVGIQAAGLVNGDGMFVSNAALSNARVAGAITSGASEAAYFFERQLDPGTLLGLTRWTR